MRTNADYDRAFALVRGVLNEWDPYGLIADGFPANEWDSEVASVVAAIPRISLPRPPIAVHALQS